jgi:hypothetical protein
MDKKVEHKMRYMTPDGTLREEMFDNFNEFADRIEDAARDTAINQTLQVETMYDNIQKREKVSIDGQEFGTLTEA